MNNNILLNTGNIEKDSWENLKDFTDARIALGRTGCSLPTNELLSFSLAHARAKDAVHMPFDKESITQQLNNMNLPFVCVTSNAVDRSQYLTRPDLGRKLSDKSSRELSMTQLKGCDVCIVIGDGLSSKAVHKQAVPLIENLLPYLTQLNLSLSPVVIAKQARVALGDEIGLLLNAKLVVMLIGERPGLSSPDSLGIYLTWMPYTGCLDSERNCISNVRPEGLDYKRSAFKLAWLIEQVFNIKLSGIKLKDRSDDPATYKIVKPNSVLEIMEK